jgi:LysM repeat protein
MFVLPSSNPLIVKPGVKYNNIADDIQYNIYIIKQTSVLLNDGLQLNITIVILLFLKLLTIIH